LLESDDGKTEVQAELAQALDVGVRAVPTFVVAERYAVQGAQPVETFARVLQQISQQIAAGSLQRTLH
jgi:predicted DsbA family dithiol-disulfide isomerase